MPTPSERKALVFLAGLFLLGAAVRTHRSLSEHPEPDAAARLALRRQLAAVDSVRAAPAAPKKPRPTRQKRAKAPRDSARSTEPVEPPRQRASVDLDIASAPEIELLPRIGPRLAARIVANRDSFGPFGSLREFQRVRGVGPATAKAVEPHVTFSLAPRQVPVTEGGYGASARRSSRRRSPPSHPP